MKIYIDELTEKELIDLNHRIVERLNFLEQMHRHAEMLEFGIFYVDFTAYNKRIEPTGGIGAKRLEPIE